MEKSFKKYLFLIAKAGYLKNVPGKKSLKIQRNKITSG